MTAHCLQLYFSKTGALTLKCLVDSVTFSSSPPVFVGNSPFPKVTEIWGRNYPAVQPLQLQKPDSHWSVWPEDFTAPYSARLVFYLRPCDRAVDLLSWRLRPANAANPGGFKPWRELNYCWYDSVSELLSETFEACRQDPRGCCYDPLRKEISGYFSISYFC